MGRPPEYSVTRSAWVAQHYMPRRNSRRHRLLELMGDGRARRYGEICRALGLHPYTYVYNTARWDSKRAVYLSGVPRVTIRYTGGSSLLHEPSSPASYALNSANYGYVINDVGRAALRRVRRRYGRICP